MKSPKLKLSADQIRGQIAAKEAELSALIKGHQERTEQYNQRAAADQKTHNELTGGISALRALIAE